MSVAGCSAINNVETWSNIPRIIWEGADWFASVGSEKCKGTKVLCLAGNVKNTGLVEVPLGTTLGEIVFDIGGGIAGGKQFKGVQIGGPSGGFLSSEYLNTLLIMRQSLLRELLWAPAV
jgi:NADH:ubiquinone oxidoreductase subunit F (NADH-binding)